MSASPRLHRLFPVLLAAAVLGSTATAADAEPHEPARAELVVTITGLAPTEGSVRCALFDSEETYLGDAFRSLALDVEKGRDTVVWRVGLLPPGRYAFVVHHDVNGNGTNDRNWLGIPSEPYAFSRQARAWLGPPSWRAASFELEEGSREMTVELR